MSGEKKSDPKDSKQQQNEKREKKEKPNGGEDRFGDTEVVIKNGTIQI